jgi:exodeoxyribonuclease VII small subunit
VTSKNKKIDFEASLKELETLVEKMEQGDISLEESLQHFERGIELTRTCQQALTEAEQKVEILLSKDFESEPQNFESE